MAKEGQTSPNRKIRGSESDKLWAASAGRCNICGTSLLRDETTKVKMKLGERAHIVGVSDGPRSPRSSFRLPSKKRNLADNLILLCEKHHTAIDKEPSKFSVEHLRELKSDFEQRIFYLSGLTKESETLVIRMLGSIHGKKLPDLTQEQARELVLEWDRRYPRFSLSSDENDVEINLRPLDESVTGYWDQVRAMIEGKAAQLKDLREKNKAGHLSVFGLARIPALIMLGEALGDGASIRVFHRRNQDGWGWSENAQLPAFETVPIQESSPEKPVTLLCSLTADVNPDRLPDELKEGSIFELRPANQPTGPTVLDHPDALPEFAGAYRQFLAQLERSHPDAAVLNLASAIQADVAIVVGQIRTPAVTPRLRVLDRNPDLDQYEFVCEVPDEV